MSTQYFGKRIKYTVNGKIHEGLVKSDSPFNEYFQVARDHKVGTPEVTDTIQEKQVIEALN